MPDVRVQDVSLSRSKLENLSKKLQYKTAIRNLRSIRNLPQNYIRPHRYA